MEYVGKFDYIIVGAGSAGCVLANRLTEDPNISVLLIEAGRKDDYIWLHIPVGYLHCINNPQTDWLYRTEIEANLNSRSLAYPRGKVLGGSSSINGMIYMRGQAQDYDTWAELTGDKSWEWKNVLPIFMKSENYWNGSDAYHGGSGEWRVEKQRLSWEILEAFRDAAAEVGIPKTDDFNRGDNEGCGYFEVNQKRGIRWSTAKAFLRPASKRGNLEIMTGCQVKRLQFETTDQGVLCSGVEFVGGSREWYAHSAHETILAAGAIGSPHILQASGIGPAEILNKAGVSIILDHPGVGENLQDHLQIRSVFKVDGVKTLNTMVHSWFGKMKIGLEYALFQSGPMSMAPSQLGAFTRSDSSFSRPNLEYHVQPLSLDKFGDPLHSFPAFTASVCNLQPSSRGNVRVQSNDPLQPPKIVMNYLSTEDDRKVALDAVKLTRKIVSASALQRYHPEELKPGIVLNADEELIEAIGTISTTIFHPVGTCKMGAEADPFAVVDSDMRVKGIGKLRVVDASVMPVITSGNTNSPTIMIAERAAKIISKSRK